MGISSSFQDVGFKRDQVVVGKVGDIRFRFLVTHVCFHWQELCSILISGDKIKRHVTPRIGWTYSNRNQRCDAFDLGPSRLLSEHCSVYHSQLFKSDVKSFFVLCEVPRGMCSSFASYTHPGKEEVHRQTSCGGGGSWLQNTRCALNSKHWNIVRKQAGRSWWGFFFFLIGTKFIGEK